jgi:septal ring factor EnvC (AmiA/AmiB activator)
MSVPEWAKMKAVAVTPDEYREAELAKLRAENEQLRTDLNKTHSEYFDRRKAHAETTVTLGKYCIRLDEARAQLAEVTRERDAAKAEVEALRKEVAK